MEQFGVKSKVIMGDNLGSLVDQMKRVFVVTDSFMAQSGKVDYVTAKLDKACILTGFGDYVEIMSPEVYEAYNNALLEAAVAEEEAYLTQEELRNEKRSQGAYLDEDYETEE